VAGGFLPREDDIPEESKVSYQSKACPRPRSGNGKEEKVFDALEWVAAMCSHVPDKGEQMVRYGACPPLAELL